MKLSAREDVGAPAAAVFAALRDYEIFERAAARRGAEVQRTGTAAKPQWAVAFDFRGKRRRLTITQTACVPPERLAFRGGGKLFEGDLVIDVIALSPRRSRVSLALEVRPLTLAARILLQSAQLARGRILRRFQKRTTELAQHLEAAAAAAGAR